MSNLTIVPLEDSFKTSLSQTWTWGTGTVNVSTTPNFTFPSGVTTYIVVNPWKSNMQIAEINAYDGSAKTLTVSNITLEKWASINSTAQTHNVWSEVIISDNYAYWDAILTAINSKLDNDADWSWSAATDYAWMTAKSLTTAQRTALTWVNGMIVLDTDLGVLYQYIWGAWSTFATWTTSNASETVAGKIEIATVAEQGTATSTGWSWAVLVMANENLVKTTAWAWDENKVWVLNASWVYDDLVSTASETTPWLVEKATDAEVITWTDTTRYISPSQTNKDTLVALRAIDAASGTITYNHSLWRIPSIIEANSTFWWQSVNGNITFWSWLNDWGDTNKSAYCTVNSHWWSTSATNIMVVRESWIWQDWVLNNVTSTTFDIVWTRISTGVTWNISIHFIVS